VNESAHLNSLGNLTSIDRRTSGLPWSSHCKWACRWVGWRNGL